MSNSLFCSVHPRVTPGVLGGSVCGGLQGEVFNHVNNWCRVTQKTK